MIREMVLYYAPQPMPYVSKLKGVLVRMGVRIKNISPDQTGQKVGHLAGMPGDWRDFAYKRRDAGYEKFYQPQGG